MRVFLISQPKYFFFSIILDISLLCFFCLRKKKATTKLVLCTGNYREDRHATRFPARKRGKKTRINPEVRIEWSEMTPNFFYYGGEIFGGLMGRGGGEKNAARFLLLTKMEKASSSSSSKFYNLWKGHFSVRTPVVFWTKNLHGKFSGKFSGQQISFWVQLPSFHIRFPASSSSSFHLL